MEYPNIKIKTNKDNFILSAIFNKNTPFEIKQSCKYYNRTKSEALLTFQKTYLIDGSSVYDA